MTQAHRPAALWLALLLAIFAALAPTVSHALNWTRGNAADLVEVCTSAGPRWMALAQVPDSSATPSQLSASQPLSDAPASSQILEHCPFCLLLADRAAPPPTQWPVDLIAPSQALAPVSASLLFLPTFAAPAPPSRGPPSST